MDLEAPKHHHPIIHTLFEYCDKYKRVPSLTIVFNGKAIGEFLNTQRNIRDPKIMKILTSNPVINNHLKRQISTPDKLKLGYHVKFNNARSHLYEFILSHNRLPSQREVYNNMRIGAWFSSWKNKVKQEGDSIYNLLIKPELNEYVATMVKNEVDRFLKSPKTENRMTFDDMVKLLFEYCDQYKKLPVNSVTYKNKKIGLFLQTHKTKIRDDSKYEYTKLCEHKLVKDELDRCLKKRKEIFQ